MASLASSTDYLLNGIGLFLHLLSCQLCSNREDETPVAVNVPIPDQCKDGWAGKLLDPPTIKVPGSTAVQCYCPANGRLLGIVNPDTPNGIDRAIAGAAEAQQVWTRTTFAARRKVLRTVLRFVLDNQESIVRAACLDSGKTRVDATFGEILVTAEKLKWTITHGEKALQTSRRPTNFLMFYKRNEVRYEPLGVVAACVSWNYPFHNFIGPVISALFTGNGIVVKNSEQTAWCTQYYLQIVRAALTACGHPPELVQAITCWPETAGYLTSHPGISHLTFIGSKPVAHEVAKSAARALIPLCVELGGKDAAIILDRPDGRSEGASELARITSIIMRGVFQSAGQNCIGIERVVAMPRAYECLVRALEPRIRALRIGNDLDSSEGGQVDVGAMVSSASFRRLESLIHEAVAQGAILLAGGGHYLHPDHPQGHYFEPTLLVNVTPEMRIAREELFAPICVVMQAQDVSQCIAIANGTLYGLGCSVFGPTNTSLSRQNLARVTRDIKAGMIAVNDFAAFYAVQLPFGGVKGSGYGRFAGEEGLRGLCGTKSTAIPGKLDYPVRDTSAKMGEGVVDVGYGDSWGRFVRGLSKMI
ncbi:ALDH-like protein [Polychaeton citri CBS 116435]|uniref:aldehyde dehydrogenase (NAD(+)) n=1 Tax=Polychaeton citri CBS 116435 TaxID=1314669 RepID=A0A9P4Q2N1_9PEZI|nr:ALDH-like protein [Polychaeton citri CBS 116435]